MLILLFFVGAVSSHVTRLAAPITGPLMAIVFLVWTVSCDMALLSTFETLHTILASHVVTSITTIITASHVVSLITTIIAASHVVSSITTIIAASHVITSIATILAIC